MLNCKPKIIVYVSCIEFLGSCMYRYTRYTTFSCIVFRILPQTPPTPVPPESPSTTREHRRRASLSASAASTASLAFVRSPEGCILEHVLCTCSYGSALFLFFLNSVYRLFHTDVNIRIRCRRQAQSSAYQTCFDLLIGLLKLLQPPCSGPHVDQPNSISLKRSLRAPRRALLSGASSHAVGLAFQCHCSPNTRRSTRTSWTN